MSKNNMEKAVEVHENKIVFNPRDDVPLPPNRPVEVPRVAKLLAENTELNINVN